MALPFPGFVRLLATLFVLLAAGVSATPPDFSTLQSLVRDEIKRLRVPGCAVAVVHEGRIAFVEGFGVANVDSGDPVRADMLFRLGSTTKMFTAAALLTLAEEGRLKLDDPIGKHVKGLAPAVARLTAHQLLTHTSGLSDPNAMDGPHDETALAERIRALGPKDFFDRPGRIYSYSNAGYWVAGHVAAEVSGQLYADLLQARIFKPLGLERTTFRPTQAMTWPLAVGHGPEGMATPRVIRPLADNAAVWPAGQLFSSAPEFARFCIAFMDGGSFQGREALRPAVITQMSASHVAVPNEDRHYGYGLSLHREAGVLWLSHGGSRAGYGSLVRMCPERRFAVIILCNKTGASLPRVADHAAQLLLGRSPPAPLPRRSLTLSADEIARYSGTYSNGRATIVLRSKNGRLVTAQEAVVRVIRERHFVREASGVSPAMEFSLVADGNGHITHLMSRGRAWRKLD